MSVLREYADALTQPTLPLNPTGAAGVRFDEVIAPDGGLRPAWKAVAEAAVAVTGNDLRRVNGEVITLLADAGVTYAPAGEEHVPWRLDPVPLMMDAATWAPLEVGLAQRAELLNALMLDLYGPQETLSEGLLPAAVVYGHAGFARPVARPTITDPQPLAFTACDLGRDADGNWRVVADRVQAPSGLGFAMQNRHVLSQVLPELFREADPHRLEPYFAAIREALVQSAPEGVTNPRVVVLSPGSGSETAYDQAYLATSLGFPLVQGGDLVVRGGSVWLKPAGWPDASPRHRVDVIVRRVDAEFCDPLEMRGDSHLGVAGLSEAVRRGRVRLVNGLGSGVLENPGLLPFLPALCERLLGEQLRLDNLPTWWCGDPDGLALVLSRLDDEGFVVRPIDQPSAAVGALSTEQLRARVLAAPHRFVGQERLPLSQAPVWRAGGRAESQPLVLRTFTTLYRAAYRPLVGGMATMMGTSDVAPATKDLWVLRDAPDTADQGLDDLEPIPFTRSIPALAPRALDDFFWSGRYAERAEDLLRLVLALRSDTDQFGSTQPAAQLTSKVLLRTLQRLVGSRWTNLDDEFRSIMLDRDRPGSVGDSVAKLRRALEGVRDQLSGDTWRALAGLDRASQALRISPYAFGVAEAGAQMLTGILALQGVTDNMIRDAAWHSIAAGRHLERAIQVCTLLQTTAVRQGVAVVDREIFESVLEAAESSVTHRRRYRGGARATGVIDLLLADLDNPRSVRYALAELRTHLGALPASTGSTRPERLVDALEVLIDDADALTLALVIDGRRPHLEEFLDDLAAQLRTLGESIEDVHFASGPPPQPMSGPTLTEIMGVAS